ncbi:MAG: ABC transporter permease subunit [Planctomyces sp.]|nr:ABC transporter permease subunit [Planctomyces sp.]
MPLHDLGYRRWDGELNPQWTRWWVIAQTGIRLSWRSRWLRRMLTLAWLPAILFGIAVFTLENAIGRSADIDMGLRVLSNHFPITDELREEVRRDPSQARSTLWALILLSFFRIPQGFLIVMLTALIAPPLIAQDIRSRAYLLYFSRPITRLEYVFGKLATVAAYLSMITLVPGVVLYLLGVGLSPSLSVVADTWDLPLRVVAASVVVIIPTATFALCLSSLLAESRYATFCWFVPWVLGWFAFMAMTAMTEQAAYMQGQSEVVRSGKWSLLSPYHALGDVETWVFGLESNFGRVAPQALMLSLVTLISMGVLLRRVVAPMRV